MEIVKKNILNILCGVVALVAIVLWIWPLGTWKVEAQEKLKQRTSVNQAMQSVIQQARHLPSVGSQDATPPRLDVFPTGKVIEWASDLKQKVQTEAELVKQYAVEVNARKVLLDGVLPVAQPTKDYEFREVYLKAVQALPGQMRVGPPPTQLEIDAVANQLWVSQFEPRVVKRDGVADPASLQDQQDAWDKECKLLPDRLKQQRAKEVICYMDPATVPPDAAIGLPSSGVAPAAQAIWYAQMHYWVQQEVLDAITEANRRASKQKCVLDAPVKYLRKLTIGDYRLEGGQRAAATAMQATGAAGGPRGAAAAGGGGMDAGVDEEMLAFRRSTMAGGGMGMGMGMGGVDMGGGGDGASSGESFTGRKSNSLYDVIPVDLVLDIETQRLPYVLVQLGNNHFITACNINLASIDSTVLGLQENVVYGSAPVVRATIHCELLMFRDWTVPLMPPPIQQLLGIQTQAQAPGAAGM